MIPTVPDREAAPLDLACAPVPPATWGPWLFRAALLATLAFFWWLVAYHHGVAPHG